MHRLLLLKGKKVDQTTVVGLSLAVIDIPYF